VKKKKINIRKFKVQQTTPDKAHPCLAERDIAKKIDMKPFVFIQVILMHIQVSNIPSEWYVND
jgi:hypothetical protein